MELERAITVNVEPSDLLTQQLDRFSAIIDRLNSSLDRLHDLEVLTARLTSLADRMEKPT